MPYRVEEYRETVLLDYKQRTAVGALRHNLLHPTPGKLKDEALHACSNRFKQSDEHILIKFFEHQKDQAAYIAAINKADLDIFRPLLNFLKDKTETPDMRQVELLAWLTDFEYRPYQNFVSKVAEKKGVRAIINQLGTIPGTLWEYITQNYLKLCLSLIPVLLLSWFLFTRTEVIGRTDPGFVYVCDSPTAVRYHLRANCFGLRNCKHRIIRVSLNDAKKTGRTLCHLEGG